MTRVTEFDSVTRIGTIQINNGILNMSIIVGLEGIELGLLRKKISISTKSVSNRPEFVKG